MILLLLSATGLLLAIGVARLLWDVTHPPRRTSAWAALQRLPMDPAEAGLSFEEWTLDRPDGARLPVWEIDLGSDATEGAVTLILLHGWARSRIDSLDRLRTVIEAVPHAVGRALLVDLRGHGESAGPGCRLGTTEIDDLLDLMRRIDGDEIVLSGHSMGAVIAIAAAVRAEPTVRRRIRGVIAWAPYRRVSTPIANRLRFQNAPVHPFVSLSLLLARPWIAAQLDTADVAASLRLPLLVVAAGLDTVAPPADAEAIAAAGKGDIVTLPTAAHGNIHHSDPDLHADALRRWFVDRLGVAPPKRIESGGT